MVGWLVYMDILILSLYRRVFVCVYMSFVFIILLLVATSAVAAAAAAVNAINMMVKA